MGLGNFRGLGALLSLLAPPCSFAQTVTEHNCDVVVVDSSLAGVMAAYQSAQQGARTCLTSTTDWLGGQISTQGISAIDSPGQLGPLAAELDRYIVPKAGDNQTLIVKENGFIPAGEYPRREGGLLTAEANRCLEPILQKIPDRAFCWVSLNCFRPTSAERALEELMAPLIANGRLKIFRETVPLRLSKNNDGTLAFAEFVHRRYSGLGAKPYSVPLSQEILDWYNPEPSLRYTKQIMRLKGKVFIDASETGEVIVLSGAQHRLGEVDDHCAPLDSESVMSFVNVLNLATENSAPTEDLIFQTQFAQACPEFINAEKLRSYENSHFYLNWNQYSFWPDAQNHGDRALRYGLPAEGHLPSLLGYRRVSDAPEITMMNFGQSQPYPERLTDRRGGNDYMDGNLIIPAEKLGDQLQRWRGGIRVDELHRSECHALAFAHWLRLQLPVLQSPTGKSLRVVWDLNAVDNFFGTGTGMAKQPYLRDTRHIVGYGGYCMTPAKFGTNFADFAHESDKTKLLRHLRESNYYAASPHSMGIASYTLDTRKYPNGNYPRADFPHMRLAEIPLEAAVSVNVPNLLVAGKGIALHQVVAAGARTQPFECNAGRGAGAAAAVAVQHKFDLHRLLESPSAIREMQNQINHSGGTTSWFGSHE
ncbi:MAG: FAD-dependent oxidoreductase [Bdellovibrionales bacterium]|nr:FAD-dependent oxidoreductase [Bdellovibrionales bacterium]